MSDDLDEVERLLAKVPRITCPKCGGDDPLEFSMVWNTQHSAPVTAFDLPSREVKVNYASQEPQDQWDERLACHRCTNIFPLPDSWDRE